MSFGASPSDIIIVVTFCKALYRKCRDAGGEYDEISREVRGLHTVLRHLKHEVEAPESPLNRDHSLWGRQLGPIIGDCDFTLRQLDGLILKYGRLSSASSSPSSPRVLWDKVRFGSNEMDQLGSVRVKLISHKTSLTLFLDTIQLHQSGKMAISLDNYGGQLDVILDKVDRIAGRMGAKEGSVMTNYEDDDKEVWKQFRRELIAEGFSSDVLQQHKDVLRAYIREIDQQGLLDEVSVGSNHSPSTAGLNPERWLAAVQPGSADDVPPSDDSGAKEILMREDNMKFPTSMKFERQNTESRELKVPSPSQSQDRSTSESVQRQSSPALKLTTLDEKEVFYLNTDGSSDDNSENEASSKRSKSPLDGQVIRTSDLVASNQALTLRPVPSGSSALNHRRQGSFGEEDVARSMAQRPKKQIELGTSPSQQQGALHAPVSSSRNTQSSVERLGVSVDSGTQQQTARLDPDEHGNEIQPDAKWTRINRRLVSPEVLNQDRRRYEARPDFVAVLGVLSRAEIEDLASRSAALRQARHLRNHPVPQPPPRPPRPSSSMPMPIPRSINQPSGRETPSTDEYSDSESDSSSPSQSLHHNLSHKSSQARRRKKKGSYQGSDAGVPISGYPNAYGAPPSPTWSPVSAKSQPAFVPHSSSYHGSSMNSTDHSNVKQYSNSPDTRKPYYENRERERYKSLYHGEQERSERHRGDRERSDKARGGERDRERRSSRQNSHGKQIDPYQRGSGHVNVRGGKRDSRWKENLTAAGIGGAAVSLLNVLTEAAEGF